MASCQWCTAPLPSGVSRCRYCGRRNDVDLRGVHEFTVVPPESPRTCPACGIPMQTVDVGAGGTFLIERCERCLSLFFDPNEVETLLERSANAAFQIDRERLDQIGRERRGEREAVRYYRCPVCGTAMNRVNFGSRSGVIVDQCPAHGMWLEGGELRRLLEWRRAGGQVHDRRRRAERAEEELQVERRRAREAPPATGEPRDLLGGGGLISLPDPTDSVRSFVRGVLRLFG